MYLTGSGIQLDPTGRTSGAGAAQAEWARLVGDRGVGEQQSRLLLVPESLELCQPEITPMAANREAALNP